ncbi:hypothetical protein FOCC_FOCC004796 [Frankliniella occidentalis]|nr:hypothetical protein FOCC_FOCC004796 [Frankliniella occidentalis]
MTRLADGSLTTCSLSGRCGAPVEMKGQAMLRLQAGHYHMRCVDRYGNHPERDAPILVGVLVGVLIAAPLTLAVVMLWRRCSALPKVPGPLWAGLVRPRKRGGDYSSAFYKPAETEPDFI